jgi:transposase
VLKVEEWIRVRELARQGVSLSEIARQTGHDRKTIRKVLSGEEPRLVRRPAKPRGSKLDPFRDYLLTRLEQGCSNGAVLLEEITRLGYAGKSTVLRDFLAPLRQERRRQQEASERFETGPGKQAQVDWAEFGRIWDEGEGRWRKLYAFVFTLGYSRAQYVEFTTGLDMEHFLTCHQAAFTALGVPAEVLYDNLKTAILGRREDGSPIFPGRFLDFALYYGFTPKFCRPYRARTKGKVERAVGYLRQNFWVRVAAEVKAGQLTLALLNERVRAWVQGVANERLHATHGQVVRLRYAEEEGRLTKLGTRAPYDTAYHALRRVGRDGRLSYRGRLYQLGLGYALATVQVEENLEGALRFWAQDGALLRAQLVLRGKPCLGPEPAAPRSTAQVAAGGLLRLLSQALPEVQTRDLGVYEEVARAAGAD